MTQNEIKQIRSLQIKKFRDELNLFVAEGDKCISELSKVFTLVQHFSADNTPLKDIERGSSLRTPQGSIAVFRKPQFPLPVIQPDTLYLALDSIQDPGNLGTIIRTADWFGIRDIICSANTADCFSPKVVQATMGALARVRVHYTDLPAWLTNAQHSTLHTALADRSRRSRDKNSQPSTLMHPIRKLKITPCPARVNLYVRLFLLFDDPVMDELRRLLLYQHRLDCLKIVRQVGSVHIRLVLELDDRAHLFVLRRNHHYERLGYIALFHPVDLLGYFSGQILVLKFRGAGIGVGHQSRVHGGVLILRI